MRGAPVPAPRAGTGVRPRCAHAGHARPCVHVVQRRGRRHTQIIRWPGGRRASATVARKTDPFPSAEPSVSAHLPARLGVRGARHGGEFPSTGTFPRRERVKGGGVVSVYENPDLMTEPRTPRRRGSGPPRCRGGRGEAGEFPSTGTFPRRERVKRSGVVSVYGNATLRRNRPFPAQLHAARRSAGMRPPRRGDPFGECRGASDSVHQV